MKVKQAIKKVVALAAGATILGATLAGALAAADLKDYPAPFVDATTHQWTGGVIVLGEKAATSDVIGAIEIAASLQTAAVTKEVVPGTGTATTSIDKGVKLEKSGDKLNYNEFAAELQSTFDNEDLPDMLADGSFEKEDFTQTLELGASSVKFVYASPGKVDKTTFDAGDYLYFQNGQDVYTYTLELDTALSYDDLADDIESKTIDIQGNTYTITNVKTSSTTGQWTEMTLQAGKTTKVLKAGEPLTIGADTITVLGVDANAASCIIDVNGENKIVNVGDTEVVGGLTIGVTNAFASNTKAMDSCEINAGAQEIKLVHNGQVTVNDAEIDGSLVTIDGNETSQEFGGFTVSYTMSDKDFADDKYGPAQYHKEGEAWIDPIFGNFKILFTGVSKSTEELTIDGDSDTGKFSFMNTKGQTVDVPIWMPSNGMVALGEDDTTPLLTRDMTAGIDVGDYPDTMLWYVLSNGEVHILQYSDFDTDTLKIEFEDLTAGKTITTQALAVDDGTMASRTLGTLGNIVVGFDAAADKLYWNMTEGNVAETEKGMEIAIVQAVNYAVGGANINLTLTEPEEDSDVEAVDNVVKVVFTEDSDANEDDINVGAPSVVSGTAFVANGVDKLYSDNDVKMYVTQKGTVYEYDDADSEAVGMIISYPEEDVYAEVFIAPLTAKTTSSGSGGSVSADKINAIPVGMAALDSDAGKMDKNMIVIGGPCINTLADELVKPTGECSTGFESGKGKIKLYDRAGKVAMLVAGMDAADTRAASRVLAQYSSYKEVLTGSEVEVTGSISTTIKVTTPTA